MDSHSTEKNGSTNDPIHFPNSALALMLAINVVGVLGNVLLIVAHVKDHPLRLLKSPSSHFILSIASADALLSGVFLVATAFTLASINTYWEWDTSYHTSVLLLLLLTSLLYSALFASYLSLAVERFLSVAYPLWHRVRVTTKVCRYWVIGLWLGLGGFRLIDFALTRIKETVIQSQLTLIVFMCVLLTLTLSVYIASYISIRRQRMELQNRTSMSEITIRTAQIRLENENNFLVTIAIVCFILAATVLPFIIMTFVTIVNATNRLEGDDSKIAVPSYTQWGPFLISLNSAANVFVYFWRLPKYRKTFKKLYCDF